MKKLFVFILLFLSLSLSLSLSLFFVDIISFNNFETIKPHGLEYIKLYYMQENPNIYFVIVPVESMKLLYFQVENRMAIVVYYKVPNDELNIQTLIFLTDELLAKDLYGFFREQKWIPEIVFYYNKSKDQGMIILQFVENDKKYGIRIEKRISLDNKLYEIRYIK